MLDSRYRAATTQLSAAGSFGLLHATMNDWGTPAKVPVLNNAFDLNTRCLQVLRPANSTTAAVRAAAQAALLLGAASHAYSQSRQAPRGCEFGPCDQRDWYKEWSAIINGYNRSGRGYTLDANDLNGIVKDAVKNFDVQW